MARIRKPMEDDLPGSAETIFWLVAVYIRLSKDDGNDESLSVTNQKKIICEYLENYFEGECAVVDFYIEM